MGQTFFDEAESPLLLSREPGVSRESFHRFAAAHPDLRTERTAEGEMIVMAPAHSRSGNQNLRISLQLGNWAVQDGHGEAYDSSTGFDLPDGSTRSPDASWVAASRLGNLTPEQRDGYLPLCPDFVVELRSKSDSIRELKAKMEEYLANGALLGWLIDPAQRSVRVYRPDCLVQTLEDPTEVSGDPELPGFILDLNPIFDPKY